MKQFSLEEYLKNPDKKVITRDGRPARIVCTDRKHERPIIALIKEKDGTEKAIYTYSTQGGFWKNNEPSSNLDLMFAPIKKEGWVNIYASQIAGDRYPGYPIYPNESEARLAVENKQTCVATIKIEWFGLIEEE